MKNLLIFATVNEAEETLKDVKARKTNNPRFFESDIGHILICGMGPKVCAENIAEQIPNYDLIINLGIVGALREDISENTIHTISEVTNEKSHKIVLQKEGLRLLTVDTELHDQEKRDLLGRDFDLVDMEGYAIAHCAQKHKKPCQMYKIVSDFCKAGGSAIIKAKLPALSKQLAKHISQIFR